MNEASILLIFMTSFAVAFSGAVMPGPVLALTIDGTVRYGFRAGPLIVLGHGILELALVIALVMGLSQFIGNEFVFGVVGTIGGITLVVMGLLTVRQVWRKAELPLPTINKAQHRALLLSGILVSASNPYWLIWWATIGITYLCWSLKLGAVGITSFFTGHILADLIWYALVAFIIVKGKRLLNAARYRFCLIVCAVALIVLGGYFVSSGIRYFI